MGLDKNITQWGLTDRGTHADRSENQITSIRSLSNLSDTTKNAIKYMTLQNESITDSNQDIQLTYLKDFVNIYLLRIEYNKLTTLDGLENMTKLTYLYCDNNQLGKNRDSQIENPELDCLKALENKKELYFLRANNNPNLIQVDYLKNDKKIRFLYLDGCNKNMTVNDIADVVLGCGTNYTLPCKFLNGIEYNVSTYYSPASVTYQELKTDLYENQFIEALSLDDVKLLSNEQLNEILKSMPKLKYLTMRNTNLTSLNFISEGNVTKLIELDLIGTSVEDLTCLNDYGKNLKTLRINNKNIDLSRIVDVINHLTTDLQYWRGDGHSGLVCVALEPLKTLEGNKDLINIYSNTHASMFGDSKILDLTGCSSLNRIVTCGWNLEIKLPLALDLVEFRLCSGTLVFPTDASLSRVILDVRRNTQKNLNDMLLSLNGVRKIDSLELDYFENDLRIVKFFDEQDINFKQIKELRVNSCWYGSVNIGSDNLEWIKHFPNLNGLYIYGDKLSGARELKSLSGIENLNNLEVLYIVHADLTSKDSLLGIERCNKLKNITINDSFLVNIDYLSELTDLQRLELTDNGISSCLPLKNLKKLALLNLRNNAIGDYSYLDDEIYNNLQILADLNVNSEKGGSLARLYLAGNNGITDFSPVSNLSWTDGDGF